MVTLYNGDCLEYMRTLPDKSVDAVVTDPPYGQNYKPGGNSSKNLRWSREFIGNPVIGDDKPFDPSPYLKYNVVILFGANNYANKLPASRGWIFWDKRCDFVENAFADGELIWTNQDVPVRKISHYWRGVIRASENGEKHFHPTQKPVAVMKWIIDRYTKPGETILDPYMGSGTTGVACVQLGRNFIGCEISPEYFAIAEKRIKQAESQPSLFKPVVYPDSYQGKLFDGIESAAEQPLAPDFEGQAGKLVVNN